MKPLLAALLLLAAPGRAADEAESIASARDSFLAGRYEDAEGAWRYITELGLAGPRPEANLALSLRDRGAAEAAAAQWLKASLLEGTDGFVWNQRGWSELALGRRREARESFVKAIDRSSTTATQAEANLGLGLAWILEGKHKAAFEPLKRAGLAGPYAISAAALLNAEASRAQGDRQASLTYLRQAVEVDPGNDEAMRRLARELDKAGDNRAAWRVRKRILSFDPKDDESRKAFEKLGKYIPGDLDAASGVRRIARPVLDSRGVESSPVPSSPTVRVGLFGAPDGRPATMTRAYLMINAPFVVTSLGRGTIRDNARAYDQWEVEFRPESGLVEVRDASRNILFTSKTPFMFTPSSPRGSVLVKSARIADVVGVDPGDRELRGSIEVVPNPWGFRLVQSAPLEQYLFGVVSLAMPEGSPHDALRAQAVVSRTAALRAMKDRPETLERCDLLDDDSTQRSIGVSGELRAAADAVRATAGVYLSMDGKAARLAQHDDSGGATESGAELGDPALAHLTSVPDSSRPLELWSTPIDLERFAHEAPPEGLWSEAAAQSAPAASRWVRIVDGKELRLRVERRKDLGRISGLRVKGRTRTGRVKAVEVEGADGRATYTGLAEIAELLAPGGLRSTLFTLQPLYDGKRIDRVVIWGAGTGSGLGFSRAGALGQAALGRGWRDILAFYFPKLKLEDGRKAPPPVKPGLGPYRRTLNYRDRQKK